MTCRVCAHASLPAIEADVRAGIGIRPIARRYDLDRNDVARHRQNCMGVVGTIEPVDPLSKPPTTDPGDARARASQPPPPPADAPDAFEVRVLYIADLIAAGEYAGRPTAKRLAEEWGVARGTVNDYARSAALVCKADRGELEQLRETSAGAWQSLRRAALDDGDLKAATQAQAGWDRAVGVVEPGGAKVQVNVLTAPEVTGLLKIQETILDALFPGVREAMAEGVEAWRKGGNPGLAAWLERRSPMLVEAEEG